MEREAEAEGAEEEEEVRMVEAEWRSGVSDLGLLPRALGAAALGVGVLLHVFPSSPAARTVHLLKGQPLVVCSTIAYPSHTEQRLTIAGLLMVNDLVNVEVLIAQVDVVFVCVSRPKLEARNMKFVVVSPGVAPA